MPKHLIIFFQILIHYMNNSLCNGLKMFILLDLNRKKWTSFFLVLNFSFFLQFQL